MLGQRRGDRVGQADRVQRARLGRRRRRGLGERRLGPGRDLVREQVEGGLDVLVGFGQDDDGTAGRDQVAGPAGIGEERHRRAGAGQDEVLDPGQLGLGLLGQVGQPVDARHPGAALQPRRERLGEQPRPGRDADPAGRAQAALGQGRPAEEEHGSGRKQSTIVDHAMPECGRALGPGWGASGRGGAMVAPSLQETSAGRIRVAICPAWARRDRAHRVLGQVAGGAAGVHPAGYGARQGLDVGLQRRVVADVAGGVGADDDHHRGPGPAGVVQVGQAVGQAGAEVQQHRGGFPGDPRVPVGGAGGDALEQREHPAHLGHRVQRADEVHLRRARVHEAYVDARAGQAGHQGLGADHRGSACCHGSIVG